MQEKTAASTIDDHCARIMESIEAVRGSGADARELAGQTVEVAAALLGLSRAYEERSDTEQRLRLARMVDDPQGCAFTTLFTDRVPRALTASTAVRTGQSLLNQFGVPAHFGKTDRILLRAFGTFGRLQPTLSAAAVRRHISKETSRYLLPDTSEELSRRLAQMKGNSVRVNLNHLGEEILSADEAEANLCAYERLLGLAEVDTVSVKISSICERLTNVAFEDGQGRISTALRRVYRAASRNGSSKLVMLDMEAYKDLELSVAAFLAVAGEPEFAKHRVGIVLQAYVPDSHAVQGELLRWAKKRVQEGGAPIRLRLVKGANLAMEQVLEEQRGWAVPVYPTKLEVDASFRRMLETACHGEHAGYLIQGVGSHNLFDVALTALLRSSLGGNDHVSLEILAGMAEPLRRSLARLDLPTMVYCPTVAPDAYHTAVAYLVRRLDENTTPGNFLCSGFGMRFGDAAWLDQKQQFLAATEHSAQVSTVSRRTARRLDERPYLEIEGAFTNEHDTDFCLSEERQRLSGAMSAVRETPAHQLAISVGGKWHRRDGEPGFDPSLPQAVPYHTSLATPQDVEAALTCAQQARPRVAEIVVRQRARWLQKAAQTFRKHRYELIALTMQDGGKIASEADAEVSEAIDFAEYYARQAVEQFEWKEARLSARGVTVVTSPWNFPLAIPLGGCFAALAVGNPVILKPAPETPGIATRAIELCHEAGIPAEFLQLIVATDEVATPLIRDQRVRAVILTGASDTARLFRRLRPNIHLLAETGGKNTLIVTEKADLDAAVGATADSAFGHSGQKCSAASLLILQEQVARSSTFLDRLAAVARSRRVGSVWDLATDQGPLIHPPSGALAEAIRRSETESGWLLKPHQDAANPRIVSPGICENVQAGSLLHNTELFGPVLGVMVAKDLDQAIRLANDTPYGLTAGLMSLDETEQSSFCERMDAGNLYVNRPTTGAVVARQPFGGRKTSSFGPGAKAGGPNYTLELVDASDRKKSLGQELPPLLRHLLRPIAEGLPLDLQADFWAASESYQHAYREHFSISHDPTGLKSQRNVFRYQPSEHVLLWIGRNLAPLDLALTLSAMAHCQVRFDLATVEENAHATQVASLLQPSLREVLGVLSVEEANDSVFAPYRRVRCLGEFPSRVHLIKNRSDAYFELAPPLRFGRIELLRYFQEQSVSIDVHRYGNLQGAALCPLGTNEH